LQLLPHPHAATVQPDETITSNTVLGRLMRAFSVRVVENRAVVDKISLYAGERSAEPPGPIAQFDHTQGGGARAFARYAVDHCQSVLRLSAYCCFESEARIALESAVSIRNDVEQVRDFCRAQGRSFGANGKSLG
jgi:hypothetical protein